MRILLVEDNEPMAVGLAAALVEQHYVVDVASDGQQALELVETFPYDLLLLDVMLPKLDGITVCQQLRSQGYQMPILLLTARDTSTDKVKGLDAGADDYLVKPFDLQELLARIRTLLRRGNSALPPVLEWGELCLIQSTCQVNYRDQPLHLTPKEYRLLELFMRNSCRVFSCSALIEHLWSFDDPPGEETVRSHIKTLRQKLKAAGAPADLIETVYGLGYRLKFMEVRSEEQEGKHASFNNKSEKSPTHNSSNPSPKNPRAESSRKQQTLAALASLWEQFKASIFNQVDALEQTAAALREGALRYDQQQQAITEAHKLTGLLGTLGFANGSQISRAIENLLRQEAPLSSAQASRLWELVGALRQVLEQPTAEQTPDPASIRVRSLKEIASLPVPPDQRPLLLIVDDDLQFNEQLLIESAGWDFRAEVVTSLSAARQWLDRQLPDIMLLDLCFPNETDDDGLRLLSELNASMPLIPVLVLTVRGDLPDRLEAARLGARAYLHKPLAPPQVLAAVSQVLQDTSTETAKILVVDDDPQMLTVLRTLLAPWGLRLTTLADPLQFWDTLEQVLPDLLILDVEMPDLNGIELCQVVRNDPAWGGLPILFLTAHTDTQTLQQVFAAGADDFVSKPIVGPELVTRVLVRLERVRLLRQLAETDPLTRLANRAKLTQDFNHSLHLAERTRSPLCLAILDLDRFKQINDQYGHGVGDSVLRWLGRLLRQSFRQGEDIVARWGGEEFVISMYGMSKALAVRRLNEILATLGQETFASPDGAQFGVTFSAGVAQYPEDGTDLQSLYRSADQALYGAKAAGRNRVLPAGSVNN